METTYLMRNVKVESRAKPQTILIFYCRGIVSRKLFDVLFMAKQVHDSDQWTHRLLYLALWLRCCPWINSRRYVCCCPDGEVFKTLGYLRMIMTALFGSEANRTKLIALGAGVVVIWGVCCRSNVSTKACLYFQVRRTFVCHKWDSFCRGKNRCYHPLVKLW